MKLCTFRTGQGAQRLGVLWPQGALVVDVMDLATAHGQPSDEFTSMLRLIEAGPTPLAKLREWLAAPMPTELVGVPLMGLELLAPIPNPPRLRCFSVYEKHLVQAFRQVLRRKLPGPIFALVDWLGLIRAPKRFFEVPIYYKGNHLAISGPDTEIPWPSYTEMLDYELELCIVIGRAGIDVPASAAPDHVFGYTILNDFSARDALMTEVGFGPSAGPAKGKDFNGGNAIGPWIVTADEFPSFSNLLMEVWVNGKIKGRAFAGDGAHSIESIISYASRGESLVPGELLSCGAVGDGTGIEQWQFLQPGDVVDLLIEPIGQLSNRIGPKPPIQPLH